VTVGSPITDSPTATTGPTGQTGSAAPDDPAAASQGILDDAIPADSAGCSAAVGRQGQVVWSGVAGLADLAARAPITTDTTFDIASTSKQFTAAAVLLLAQQDKIDLTAPMSTYLTGFPAWADQVRVTDLIHHRTGIPGYIELLDAQGLDRNDQVTQQLVLDTLRQVTDLRADPGTTFEYSDSNYLLLAEIVETTSGADLATYLRDNVFDPAGVDIVLDPVGPVPDGAVPYETFQGAVRDTKDRWEEYGATGVQASPSELVRWADNYRTGAVGGQEMVRAMTEDDLVVMDGPDSYGGGLMINTTTRGISHPGAWLGFTTNFSISPDRTMAIAVSCNFYDIDIDIRAITNAIAHIWIPGA
jgi:CubicO group peptidase (beta-lactamase class C family)